MNTVALEVVCPSCTGRSAIDREFRSFAQWACPFCHALNPMPVMPAMIDLTAPAPPQAPPRHTAPPKPAPESTATSRRIAWVPLTATAAVLAIMVASYAVQATRPAASYRTAAGLAAALQTKGLGCGHLTVEVAHPQAAREQGTCVAAGQTVTILTFSDRRRRDDYLRSATLGHRAGGETWLVLTTTRPAADAIAVALHGVSGG